MPTSDYRLISAVLNKAVETEPKSVLDLGIGRGKYGFLLREYLDVEKGNYEPKKWKVYIEGVEAFKKYDNAGWAAYSSVQICDVRRYKYERNFDLILLCDVLEHMSRGSAFRVLKKALEHGKRVIVTTPNGFFRQDAVFGNPYEKHLSGFIPKDFMRFGCRDAAVFGEVFMVSING